MEQGSEKGSKNRLTRRHLEGRNTLFQEYDPVCPSDARMPLIFCPTHPRRTMLQVRKGNKSHKHKYFQGSSPIRPPSLGPPQTHDFFFVRPLGCPKIIKVRNVVHLEI